MMRLLILSLTLSLAALMLLAWGAGAAPATRYVAPHADCAGAMPCYATLQAAIDAAAPGDELRVAQGVYTDVTAFEYRLSGWTQVITQAMFISKPLTVRGGYTVTDWTVSQPLSYPTVINPQGQGRGGVIAAPTGQPPIAVTMEGLGITHGYAEGSGGGLYAEGGAVTISRCHIHHNEGGSLASGLYLNSDTVTLRQNRIEYNTGGHGLAIDMGIVVSLSDNEILSNTNGLLLWNNRVVMTNTVSAGNDGSGLIAIGSNVRAWHTTLADNGVASVWVQNSGQGPAMVALTNTILAGPGVGVQVVDYSPSPSTVRLAATLWHHLTETQITGNGFITRTRDLTGDPAFVGTGDYHLTAASPARNRGLPSGVTYDITGIRRDPLPDLGAYEYDDPDSIRQVCLPLVLNNTTSVASQR